MEKVPVHPPDAAIHGDVEPVPLPPGYTRRRAEKERVYALKVVTDTLYPYLRKNTYLYVTPMPLSHIISEDLVIYRDEGGVANLKEVECLPGDRIVLKGLGRGATLTFEAKEVAEIDIVFLVARPKT